MRTLRKVKSSTKMSSSYHVYDFDDLKRLGVIEFTPSEWNAYDAKQSDLIQSEIQNFIDTVHGGDGKAPDASKALLYFAMVLAPAKMQVESDDVSQAADGIAMMTNILNAVNHMKEVFNSVKGMEDDHAFYTAQQKDFLSVISQLERLINPSNTSVNPTQQIHIHGQSSDSMWPDAKTKDNFLKDLNDLKDIVTSQCSGGYSHNNDGIMNIWAKALDATDPNSEPLKQVLTSFDSLSTMGTSISNDLNSEMKYDSGMVDQMMNVISKMQSELNAESTAFIKRLDA